MSPPASVCFVAPNAYPALSGRADLEHGGGAERQQVLLARELVRLGHRVSFVVLDHGQKNAEEIDGIQVFTSYRPNRGVRGVRFFHPRLSGLWHAMGQANADVYYQRGAEAETGFVRLWTHRHARAFVFATASDTDCIVRSPMMPRWSEQILFRYGLRRANAVVVQTSRQREMLMAEFGVTSTIIRSCFVWPWEGQSAESVSQNGRILWAGRLSAEKRPEWALQLARELPECQFRIVGPCDSNSTYGRGLIAQIQTLPNVQWAGHVPHQRMLDGYLNAQLLLCTSPVEGFPNVFLEAWSCGVGVLSTVDPDGVIVRYQTGKVAASLDEIKYHLASANERSAFWTAAGYRGRQYVRDHHQVRGAGETLVRVVTEAVIQSGNVRQCFS